jgi:WD40 repeat protein
MTAKVWGAGTGQELLTLEGHTDVVRSVTFSPDGNRIVTGSDDRTAKVWDAGTGQELLALKGHTHAVWSVAFSPDGQRIVTGIAGAYATARVWYAAPMSQTALHGQAEKTGGERLAPRRVEQNEPAVK